MGNMVYGNQSEAFLESNEFVRALSLDDGQAAQSHLAAGRPIYYMEKQYPDELIREFPDGHRQIVALSADGTFAVVRNI